MTDNTVKFHELRRGDQIHIRMPGHRFYAASNDGWWRATIAKRWNAYDVLIEGQRGIGGSFRVTEKEDVEGWEIRRQEAQR